MWGRAHPVVKKRGPVIRACSSLSRMQKSHLLWPFTKFFPSTVFRCFCRRKVWCHRTQCMVGLSYDVCVITSTVTAAFFQALSRKVNVIPRTAGLLLCINVLSNDGHFDSAEWLYCWERKQRLVPLKTESPQTSKFVTQSVKKVVGVVSHLLVQTVLSCAFASQLKVLPYDQSKGLQHSRAYSGSSSHSRSDLAVSVSKIQIGPVAWTTALPRIIRNMQMVGVNTSFFSWLAWPHRCFYFEVSAVLPSSFLWKYWSSPVSKVCSQDLKFTLVHLHSPVL